MMMPGAANMRQQLENFDEREIDRVEAIVRSMTPHERVAPKILNGSRRARIAKGSGVHVSEVNGLLERFGQAQKMMKKMAQGGGIPGMPGVAGPGGFGGARKKQQAAKGKKKTRSGNPAKAAQELREAEERRKNKASAGRKCLRCPGRRDRMLIRRR